MKVLSLRFAGFPVLHDGGTNATALILSSLLRFLGGNYHIVEDGSNWRRRLQEQHPPFQLTEVRQWVWYLFVLEDFFYFFYVPMRFTNTRWCVGQVEPVWVSTIVDTGIILRGLLRLVQVEAYVRTDVLHPERSFTVVGFQTTVYVEPACGSCHWATHMKVRMVWIGVVALAVAA